MNATEKMKTFNEKLEKSYILVAEGSDLPDLTTGYLFSLHEYSYSQVISNELNNLQGKNRRTHYSGDRKLMVYAPEEDVDLVVDKQLNDLLVNSLNTYLSDKQVLPESAKFSAGIISRVKAMLLMLFGTGQYGIIPRLNLPEYVKPYVEAAFDKINETKEDTLDDWIAYLESSGNDFLVDIVRSKGNEFWGSETSDAQDVFQRNFQQHLKKIVNYEKTYQMFLYYRSEFMKASRSMTMNRLFETFEMTNNQYDKGRRSFINEFPQMFNESESSNLILKLIYEE